MLYNKYNSGITKGSLVKELRDRKKPYVEVTYGGGEEEISYTIVVTAKDGVAMYEFVDTGNSNGETLANFYFSNLYISAAEYFKHLYTCSLNGRPAPHFYSANYYPDCDNYGYKEVVEE